MTDRDDLAAIIHRNIPDGSDLKAADAILAAGWIPPAAVTDLQDQLDRARHLIRTMHREQMTPPVGWVPPPAGGDAPAPEAEHMSMMECAARGHRWTYEGHCRRCGMTAGALPRTVEVHPFPRPVWDEPSNTEALAEVTWLTLGETPVNKRPEDQEIDLTPPQPGEHRPITLTYDRHPRTTCVECNALWPCPTAFMKPETPGNAQ